MEVALAGEADVNRAVEAARLAFEAGPLDPWEDRLAAAGVPIDDRTDTTLFIRDPDGHRVGLSVYPFPPEFFTPSR